MGHLIFRVGSNKGYETFGHNFNTYLEVGVG